MTEETEIQSLARPPAPEQATVVALPVEIDMASKGDATTGLTAAITAGPRLVIADLTGTTFIDSSGARILCLAHRDAVARGVQLRFAINHPSVLRVLQLMGYDQVLPIYPTIGEARTG